MRLASIVSLVDQSNITLLYEMSLLSEIHHSNGERVSVQYNKVATVKTIELIYPMSTEGAGKKM